jgi:hypothetical protein
MSDSAVHVLYCHACDVLPCMYCATMHVLYCFLCTAQVRKDAKYGDVRLLAMRPQQPRVLVLS